MVLHDCVIRGDRVTKCQQEGKKANNTTNGCSPSVQHLSMNEDVSARYVDNNGSEPNIYAKTLSTYHVSIPAIKSCEDDGKKSAQ